MKSIQGIRYCILAALIAAAGCAAQPEENAMLEQARSAYNAARNDTLVVENAPLELAKAEENLLTAKELWEDDAEKAQVDHYAYLSRQQTAIAREAAQLEKYRQAVEDAEAERVRVLLEVRAREAEAARRQAETAQLQLEEVRRRVEEQARQAQMQELEEARQNVQARQQELEEARKRAEEQALVAETRLRELEKARRMAEESTRQAELARQQAAGLEEELAQLKARPTERGMVVTLGDVLFDLDKAELNPGANLVMDRLAAFLKNHEERRVLVEGFTDSTGPEDYNMQLSERRARSVRHALMDRGIAGDRIEVRGYGEGFPVATNETIAGRQQNRRVEIVFSDEEGRLPGQR